MADYITLVTGVRVQVRVVKRSKRTSSVNVELLHDAPPGGYKKGDQLTVNAYDIEAEDYMRAISGADPKATDRLNNALRADIDPTPYCSDCGARSRRDCHCHPIAENN
jgi:hypothetical protein